MSIVRTLIRRKERGQILILGALLLTALLGLVGIIVDGGMAYAQRRQAQNAADNAAVAAIRVLFEGGTSAQAASAATSYGQANGFEAGDITFNYPPTSGAFAGNLEYVEVYVEEEPNTFFIHVVVGGATVRARGVAGLTDVPKDYALLVLNETSCEAFEHDGTPGLTINGGGGIMVNSDCEPNAFYKHGSGNLSVSGDIDVHGLYQVTGSGTTTPEPEQVPWTADDPLAGTPPPERGTAMACPTGGTGTAASPDTCTIGGASNRTLNPGTFYGGLDLQCNCTITLNPGIYIMSGGGFTKSGQTRVNGEGVMIYVTTNPDNPTGDGSPLPFNISGGGALNITPIEDTSSPYYGISLWQDEAITSDFYLSGNASGFGGIIYAPGAKLDIAGVSSEISEVQIIAKDFQLRGTSDLTINYKAWRQVLAPNVFLVE